MSLPFRICIPAETDISSHADFLARENVELALRFITAIEESIDEIVQMPGLGAACQFSDPKFAGMRSWRVKAFRRHRIYYRIVGSEVEVVRVLHSSRDLNLIFAMNSCRHAATSL